MDWYTVGYPIGYCPKFRARNPCTIPSVLVYHVLVVPSQIPSWYIVCAILGYVLVYPGQIRDRGPGLGQLFSNG